MNHLRLLAFVGLLYVVPFGAAGDKDKPSDTWAKIISGLITADQSKRGLELQQNAAVKPDTLLTYPAKDLGVKLSLKMIAEKYGKPTKMEEYQVKDGGRIVTRVEHHYPPIQFVADKGSDDVLLITAPKRLWSGPGILENAKAALRMKPSDE